MTYVRNDEDEVNAVKHMLARIENYLFKTNRLLADGEFYNERVICRGR